MNKNRVVRDAQGRYTLTTIAGDEFACTRWYEKKTDAWHIKLPKDNPTGRTYIRESLFGTSGAYEFDDKTEHRTGLATGGWRAKMTPDEAKKVADAEAIIEAIKAEASARVVEKVDPNSIEGLEAMIVKSYVKLAAKKGITVEELKKQLAK